MIEAYEKIRVKINDLIREYNKNVQSGFFNSKALVFSDVLKSYKDYIKLEFNSYIKLKAQVKKEYNLDKIEIIQHSSKKDYIVSKCNLEINMDDDKIIVHYLMHYNSFEECFDINNRDLGELEIISIKSENEVLRDSSLVNELIEAYINCFNRCQSFQIKSDDLFITMGLDRQDNFESTDHATEGNVFLGLKYKETRNETYTIDYDVKEEISYVSIFVSGKEGYFEGPSVTADNYVFTQILKELMLERRLLPNFLQNSKEYIENRNKEEKPKEEKEQEDEDISLSLSEESKRLLVLLQYAEDEIKMGSDPEKAFYRLMAGGVRENITSVERLSEILPSNNKKDN